MLEQAAGFALLAAISPTALLVMAVFLGSANPRRTALAYVAGAFLMSVTMAVTLLLVIRAAGLDQPRDHAARYGLRLAIGMLALAAAFVVIRRRPRPAGSGKGLMSRLVASPSARSGFVAGIILFAPSATFLAAVQVVATANADTAITALGLVIIVILSVLVVWLPLLGFLAAPEATTRRLSAIIGRLTARGKVLGASALAVGGVILLIDGILGLT